MTSRKQRRAIILSIYVIIFFLITWWIVSAVRPGPTCNDDKKNQDEVSVDCGGICGACAVKIAAVAPEIVSSHVVSGTDGRFDAVTQIINPNQHSGSAIIEYRFVLKDESKKIIGSREGVTFILPAEKKYIVELGIDTAGKVVQTAEFFVTRVVWEVFDGLEEPQIVVINKQFDLIGSATEHARVSGVVRNESDFDFNSITVNIILKDKDSIPIALHRTRMDTFDVGIERGFSLPWPEYFAGDVSSFDVEVEANVFDTQNFRKQYGAGSAAGQF